ncbi:helix-turn-helix domain-containing protein [Halorhodospira sp. 9621]|uniref:helix-turn-helix domain-containing protein n=1 Tax=Halorhodospira sp. 9621 TaxID=2899135 RepID=UPI001EE7BDA8|nr:helix-turn-helix domain-containing protein [Halorhodospira sp. 9621]MCG5533015.1 helix-turn-helix domain-containing protein [Halorhodospira sp. 9621]
MVDELATTEELAGYLCVSQRTLERWRRQRIGPAWVRVGHKIRYRREDVDAWLAKHRQEPVLEVAREAGARGQAFSANSKSAVG